MMIVIMWAVMSVRVDNKNNGDKSVDSTSNRGEWYKNRKKMNSFIQLPSNQTLFKIRNILPSTPTLLRIGNILL